MPTTLKPLLDHGLEPTAALLTEGFTGYFVPIQMSAVTLLGMMRGDSGDFNLSRIIVQDDKPVGVALIGRRGWTSRLGAMSIIPDARGQGVGGDAMRQLLDEARTRGENAMVLEVIEQNTPAVKLYSKCGFRTQRRLVGFSSQVQAAPSNTTVEQIDILDVARALVAYGPADIPWQISGESLAAAGPPGLAFRNENSLVAITNPEAPTINIRGIVTLPEARRRGSATALLQAVIARYPEKTWNVSATFPEELAGLYTGLGLERVNISQFQMIARL